MSNRGINVVEISEAGHHQRDYIVTQSRRLRLKEKCSKESYMSLFQKMFLPNGYPESVSCDYLPYQIWDTAQAFCSTITGILVTQEVLRAVGVGDEGASVLAATILWILKEACGHIGKIVFSFFEGRNLDAYSKVWRLQADILNDLAMVVELALPTLGQLGAYALCVSTMLKAVVGIAGGATRVALTQHHAIRGNIGDVSAKDAVQETAVNLLASMVALVLLNVCSRFTLKVIFISTIGLHLACNYAAVKAVCLRSLNKPRFIIIVDQFIKYGTIPTVAYTNRKEPLYLFRNRSFGLDSVLYGFTILQGVSIMDTPARKMSPRSLKTIDKAYKQLEYWVIEDPIERKIYVVLKTSAGEEDCLQSFFHAIVVAFVSNILSGSELADEVALREYGSTLYSLMVDIYDSPPENHTSLINNYVVRKWMILRSHLYHSAWYMTNHLLQPGHWRLGNISRTASR